MKRVLFIFKIFDLLYYASFRTMIKSRNFDKKTAGLWMTRLPEAIFTISMFFILCRAIGIDLDLILDGSSLSIFLCLLIMYFFFDIVDQYHINRHEDIITKYSFIQKEWQCWSIIISYIIVILGLIILSGLYYNHDWIFT